MVNRKQFIQQSALATLSTGMLALQGCKDEKQKGFNPENIKDENADTNISVSEIVNFLNINFI